MVREDVRRLAQNALWQEKAGRKTDRLDALSRAKIASIMTAGSWLEMLSRSEITRREEAAYEV